MTITFNTYLKIIIFNTANQLVSEGFQIPEVLILNKEFIKNVAAQLVGYSFAALSERVFDANTLMPPILSEFDRFLDFINFLNLMTSKEERIATLAVLMSSTGLLSRNVDSRVKLLAGGFFYAFFRYIYFIGSNSDSMGSFISPKFNRKINLFSKKELLQFELFILAVFVLIIVSLCFITYLTNKCIYLLKKNNKRIYLVNKKKQFILFLKKKFYQSLFI